MNIIGDELVPYGIQIFSLEIRFYAVCIILGAVLAYLFSRAALKKYGYSCESFDNLFSIVFIAGIIGARLWYVIAQDLDNIRNIGDIFNFMGGGLAIQGGVIAGVLTGIILLRIQYPKIPVLVCVDSAVPTILLAQGIGRWGNFFNHEVYGKCVNEGPWKFLGSFILDNTGGVCVVGQVAVPLFLVESVLNVAGFLLLYYGLKKLFAKTKFSRSGDLGAAYFVYYGIIRTILEPLRDSQFQMGNMISLYVSILFILGGVGFYLFIHFYQIFKTKTKLVIFDLDGTLLDNNEHILGCVTYLFEKYNPSYKLTLDVKKSFLGPPLIETIPMYFKQDYEELLADYRSFGKKHQDNIKLFPNIKETLDALKQQKIKMAIVTSKKKEVAIDNLKLFGIENYFDVIIGCDDTKSAKPSPSGIFKVLIQLKTSPLSTIYLGDSQTDILAAKRGLVKAIGVKWSYKVDELVKLGCDQLIDDPLEIVPKI
jgi:phosphatidylglycerol:prolipoprotein diacylglycerol transferase